MATHSSIIAWKILWTEELAIISNDQELTVIFISAVKA